MRHSGWVLIAVVGALFGVSGCAGGGGPTTSRYPNARDMDVVIYLDAQCNVLKSNPSVGFSNKKVTWHLRGACGNHNGQSFSIVFTNTSPANENCPHDCQATISNGAADVTVSIKPNSGNTNPYPYTLTAGTTKLDPDLIIDP